MEEEGLAHHQDEVVVEAGLTEHDGGGSWQRSG